jgi:hypothetical protein
MHIFMIMFALFFVPSKRVFEIKAYYAMRRFGIYLSDSTTQNAPVNTKKELMEERRKKKLLEEKNRKRSKVFEEILKPRVKGTSVLSDFYSGRF